MEVVQNKVARFLQLMVYFESFIRTDWMMCSTMHRHR